jgi:hypothetical protein
MKLMKVILFVLTTFHIQKLFGQNGYSLEFEDVVTLSVDSLIYPTNGVYTKSYIVPAGTVLKINSGHLSSAAVGTATPKIYTGFLKINNNLIIGADTALLNLGTSGYRFLMLRITPEKAIWAPSNATVILGVEINQPLPYSTNGPLFSNWISGVLFRKVSN